MQGRDVFVNGIGVNVGQVPLPARSAGKLYFRFTAGSAPWTGFSFW
jgi:hypothetical protein